MFGFLAACVVITETTKTAVDKMKRKCMAGRLPSNPWRENGKNRWIKNSTGAALNLLRQPSGFLFSKAQRPSKCWPPHTPSTARLRLLLFHFPSAFNSSPVFPPCLRRRSAIIVFLFLIAQSSGVSPNLMVTLTSASLAISSSTIS